MTNRILDEQIKEELKKTGGNLSKVARSLGIPYWPLVQRYGPTAMNVLPRPAPRPSNIQDLGNDPHKQHVIAIKRCGDQWGQEFDDVIADARAKFDAGTHEMFQTTNQGWVVQYLAPRRRPTRRRYFFQGLGR